MPRETAAFSARSVYTVQPCTMSLHATPRSQVRSWVSFQLFYLSFHSPTTPTPRPRVTLPRECGVGRGGGGRYNCVVVATSRKPTCLILETRALCRTHPLQTEKRSVSFRTLLSQSLLCSTHGPVHNVHVRVVHDLELLRYVLRNVLRCPIERQL